MKIYINHFSTIPIGKNKKKIQIDLVTGEVYASVFDGNVVLPLFKGLESDDDELILRNKKELAMLVLASHGIKCDEFDFI